MYVCLVLSCLLGTPPGMSQSEYEPIHSAQVQRDKEKLVRQGNVLAPSNTTQFLIRDHNRQTTPSSIATPTPIPTPTHQTSSQYSSIGLKWFSSSYFSCLSNFVS
jgi:hypothetical protein